MVVAPMLDSGPILSRKDTGCRKQPGIGGLEPTDFTETRGFTYQFRLALAPTHRTRHRHLSANMLFGGIVISRHQRILLGPRRVT